MDRSTSYEHLPRNFAAKRSRSSMLLCKVSASVLSLHVFMAWLPCDESTVKPNHLASETQHETKEARSLWSNYGPPCLASRLPFWLASGKCLHIACSKWITADTP